jgi:hypothetical protein
MTKLMSKKQKSIAKVVALSDILFPVWIHDNPRATNKPFKRVVTGLINGEEKDLNYCSKVYSLIPAERIFPRIEQILNDHQIVFEVVYRMNLNPDNGHAIFYADYIITDKRFAYYVNGKNDPICPMLRVQHSYDGSLKYAIIFGYYRVVCENGLIIAVEEMKQFNLQIVGKHTKTVEKSFTALNNLLLHFTENASTITTAITSKYEILGGRWVENPEDRIKEVLEAVNITMVDNKKFVTVNDILNHVNEEAGKESLGYNNKVNDWLIYNGINQYLYDDTRNSATREKRMMTDSKVFEYMLAHEMA